ncbi:hypothetical protein TA3x_002648 [Tundrisphaera sp. TA3]|uniref:hypothetical protein n=1 Tax=Tundrisphaera sp. TA3 TaxID=3435775 RepID=UPI003EB8902C
MMRTTGRMRWWWLALPVLAGVGADPAADQGPAQPPTPAAMPTSLRDPSLETLRQAGVAWEIRTGPERTVVDQVCLVPDVPTFLEVIATWDRTRYFPVLFDDVESSFRFIRAFKPARIIRYPRAVAPVPEAQLWSRATAAVGASWKPGGPGSAKAPPMDGGSAPEGIGATPPGVVLSSPDAPMLAGAVALAAGRFQPLARLTTPRKFPEILTGEQARTFCQMAETVIGGRVIEYRRLGDACDFITLAGDWPYRYRGDDGQVDAVDDLIGRSSGNHVRWAYAGRLLGESADSAYRAMCSLFLQPESALMFNGYAEDAPPWSDYATRLAATRFSAVVPTHQVSGTDRASIHGWHDAFGAENPHGLVWVNSHGSPTVFNLQGGPASAADIPRGVPTAVAMIHSFSSADPTNPDTVAGRWLANGAFVFYGSVNEPYLQAFRTPLLIGDLLGEKIPMAAAVRKTMAEAYGQPWRLIYLGDPLYRVHARVGGNDRTRHWIATSAWPRYQEAARPGPGNDEALLTWALQAALSRFQAEGPPPSPARTDLAEALLGIRRDRISAPFRPVHDALLAEILLTADRRPELLAKLDQVPPIERTPDLRRLRETCLAIELDRAIARDAHDQARAVWASIIGSDASRELKEQSTARVGKLNDAAGRRAAWAGSLREGLRLGPRPPESEIIAAELRRIGESPPP